MKLKTKAVFAALSMAALANSYAAVTITFNAAFAGGVSSNLANFAGVPTDGLFYGVLVDGNGSGFGSAYDAIVPTLGGSVELLSDGAATGHYLFFASDRTADTSLLLEGDFVTAGGVGGVSGVAFDFIGSVSSGDRYALVWLDLDGVNAGILEHESFVIPSDGNVVTHDAVFLGEDPIRAARGIEFGVIPEPSIALLGLMGACGLIRRRR